MLLGFITSVLFWSPFYIRYRKNFRQGHWQILQNLWCTNLSKSNNWCFKGRPLDFSASFPPRLSKTTQKTWQVFNSVKNDHDDLAFLSPVQTDNLSQRYWVNCYAHQLFSIEFDALVYSTASLFVLSTWEGIFPWHREREQIQNFQFPQTKIT